MQHTSLRFGIYPGGSVGTVLGRVIPSYPDQPACISRALNQLQGRAHRPFAVRCYAVFTDDGDSSRPSLPETPAAFDQYAVHGRMLDLVAAYHSSRSDIEGYCAFVETLIEKHGARTSTLQICEEPNVTDNPSLDGYYPNVARALVAGVHAAKQRTRLLGYDHLRIGCNSTLLFGQAAGFWNEIVRLGGDAFAADLDYIGVDLYPDVFRPIAASHLGTVVQRALFEYRSERLGPAGLAHLPLFITEHGWPTGPERPPERQAEVLRTVIGSVADNTRTLNLGGYTHFSLRDADTANADLFCHFGLMTDNYEPKPAFRVFADLIALYTDQADPAGDDGQRGPGVPGRRRVAGYARGYPRGPAPRRVSRV